jgi:hypothetical protein
MACQIDVIKHMLYQPILRGRIGKWAYTLIDYDLALESIRLLSMELI